MAEAATAYRRDQRTSESTSGAWLKPGHWASVTVHAFHRWTGETSFVTWCGIAANTADGARLTTDTITCLTCPGAWMEAFKG